MYSQQEVRKLIMGECLKNFNVLIKFKETVSRIIISRGNGRGLERMSRNQERSLSSLKIDQKVIRGI